MRQEHAMLAIYVSWGVSGAVLLVLAVVVGIAANKRIDGILIDKRGRYSLTHFQLCLWTITILSLLSGVFFGRLVHGVTDPLDITIPGRVLGLLGISLASGVTATTVKRTKDITHGDSVSVSGGTEYPPRLAQMFFAEEGAFANQIVDISKFQGFVVTVLLVVAYIAVSVNRIGAAPSAQALNSLPDLSSTWLVLLAISHGAYVTAKIPPSSGTAEPSVEARDEKPAEFAVQKRHRSVPAGKTL
jgi:hypothetical protein